MRPIIIFPTIFKVFLIYFKIAKKEAKKNDANGMTSFYSTFSKETFDTKYLRIGSEMFKKDVGKNLNFFGYLLLWFGIQISGIAGVGFFVFVSLFGLVMLSLSYIWFVIFSTCATIVWCVIRFGKFIQPIFTKQKTKLISN